MLLDHQLNEKALAAHQPVIESAFDQNLILQLWQQLVLCGVCVCVCVFVCAFMCVCIRAYYHLCTHSAYASVLTFARPSPTQKS